MRKNPDAPGAEYGRGEMTDYRGPMTAATGRVSALQWRAQSRGAPLGNSEGKRLRLSHSEWEGQSPVFGSLESVARFSSLTGNGGLGTRGLFPSCSINLRHFIPL